MNHLFKKPAFTLIELLVVITIISLLASLVITQLSTARIKARNAAAESDIIEIGKAIEVMKNSTEKVLSAVNPSPGAGRFSFLPRPNPNVAYAVIAIPLGDRLQGTTDVNFTNLLSSDPNDTFHYPVKIVRTPSDAYIYEYRTTDNLLPTGGHHSYSAYPDYTVVATLDTSNNASSAAFFWVRDGSSGSGDETSIPAP